MPSSPQAATIQLKYCERCGALFLRLQSAAVVYCAPCARNLADCPPPLPATTRAARRPKSMPEIARIR